MFWNKKPAPVVEPVPVVEPIAEAPRCEVVIGKYFFADETSGDGNEGQFSIWSAERVIDGQSNGVAGVLFSAWDREQAAKIVAFLDVVMDRENEKKAEKEESAGA